MFSAPDGMSSAQFNAHPVRQMIRIAAYAGEAALPSRAELDLLELPTDARERVRKHCKAVAALQAEGLHEDAWVSSDELAADVISSLPEELRDPGYLTKPATADPSMGPKELAGLVPRSGSW